MGGRGGSSPGSKTGASGGTSDLNRKERFAQAMAVSGAESKSRIAVLKDRLSQIKAERKAQRLVNAVRRENKKKQGKQKRETADQRIKRLEDAED